MDIKEAGQTFEDLINDNEEFRFVESDVSSLPIFASFMVKNILDPHGIKWKIGNLKVGPFLCLSLEDPLVKYLTVGPNSFMWCDEGHHNSIHPDDVFIHLLKTYQGVDASISPDRSVLLKNPKGL